MTGHAGLRGTRPTQAIDARRQDAAAKLAAVAKAIKAIGHAGTPVSRTDVARLSGVPRSFTYQNEDANTLITDAQTRTLARPIASLHAVTAQQEASWRERALNAEDRTRQLNHDLTQQRQLVADLLGQLRDPDGTWLEDDRTRLRRGQPATPARTQPVARDSTRPAAQTRRRPSQRHPLDHRPRDRTVPTVPARAAG